MGTPREELDSWDELSESQRESNCRHADDIEPKLARIGYRLAEAPAPDGIDALSAEQVDQLARDEHERWCADRRASGWEPGDTVDAERRRTPWLIPYDELPEDQKEMDRVLVKAIPAAAAAVGLAVIPAQRPRLRDEDMPGLFRATDARAIENRNRYFRTSATRLLVLIAAPIVGAAIGGKPAGIAAAVVFLLALLLQALRIVPESEKLWVGSRSLGEQTRSLAWRYAVGGAPFPIDGEAREPYLRQIERLIAEAGEHGIHLGAGGLPITSAMTAMRTSPFDARRDVYARDRIENQIAWYAGKAATSHTMAARWWWLAIVAQVAGLAAAALLITGTVSASLLGIASTVAAAAVGWSETRAHSRLAAEYGIAYNRLSAQRVRLADQTPESWGAFVQTVEDMLLAENKTWLEDRGD